MNIAPFFEKSDCMYEDAIKQGIALRPYQVFQGIRYFVFLVTTSTSTVHYYVYSNAEAVKRLVQLACNYHFGKNLLGYVMDIETNTELRTYWRPARNGDSWEAPSLQAWLKDQGVQELVISL